MFTTTNTAATTFTTTVALYAHKVRVCSVVKEARARHNNMYTR